MSSSPLGVFDSGLGGLTVARALARALPAEQLLYFGDNARVPYGNKSAGTVTRLSLEALRFMEHAGAKALVVACNSASASAMPALVGEAGIPVIGVVDAGASEVAAKTRSGRVGVLGTRGTIRSGCYEQEIRSINPEIVCVSAACPLFVPLVEEGWLDAPVTREVAREYLAPLTEARVDAVILGCTHYPLLRGVIQDVLGAEVELIDSGHAVAAQVKSLLEEQGLSAGTRPQPQHVLLASDRVEDFEREARRFLGTDVPFTAGFVDQSDVPWYDRLPPGVLDLLQKENS